MFYFLGHIFLFGVAKEVKNLKETTTTTTKHSVSNAMESDKAMVTEIAGWGHLPRQLGKRAEVQYFANKWLQPITKLLQKSVRA